MANSDPCTSPVHHPDTSLKKLSCGLQLLRGSQLRPWLVSTAPTPSRGERKPTESIFLREPLQAQDRPRTPKAKTIRGFRGQCLTTHPTQRVATREPKAEGGRLVNGTQHSLTAPRLAPAPRAARPQQVSLRPVWPSGEHPLWFGLPNGRATPKVGWRPASVCFY